MGVVFPMVMHRREARDYDARGSHRHENETRKSPPCRPVPSVRERGCSEIFDSVASLGHADRIYSANFSFKASVKSLKESMRFAF